MHMWFMWVKLDDNNWLPSYIFIAEEIDGNILHTKQINIKNKHSK